MGLLSNKSNFTACGQMTFYMVCNLFCSWWRINMSCQGCRRFGFLTDRKLDPWAYPGGHAELEKQKAEAGLELQAWSHPSPNLRNNFFDGWWCGKHMEGLKVRGQDWVDWRKVSNFLSLGNWTHLGLAALYHQSTIAYVLRCMNWTVKEASALA